MHKFRIFSAVALSGALFAVSAMAGEASPFRGEARLLTPVSAPSQTQIGAAQWACDADTCKGSADRTSAVQSMMKECRAVAAALGPLASYRSRGREFSPGNLAVCNKAAQTLPKTQVAGAN